MEERFELIGMGTTDSLLFSPCLYLFSSILTSSLLSMPISHLCYSHLFSSFISHLISFHPIYFLLFSPLFIKTDFISSLFMHFYPSLIRVNSSHLISSLSLLSSPLLITTSTTTSHTSSLWGPTFHRNIAPHFSLALINSKGIDLCPAMLEIDFRRIGGISQCQTSHVTFKNLYAHQSSWES